MKFHIGAAVLGCALLSLSYADVAEKEQILSPLVDVPQNVDSPVAIAEETIPVGSPEIQKVLTQLPELVQASADKKIIADPVLEDNKNTEAIVIPQNGATNREAKQLIGFIPSYVLRQAIRRAQKQQYNDMRSFRNNYAQDRSPGEVEEERSVRRRKRFRTRTSNDHLNQTRRHKNTNQQRLNRRRNSQGNRRTQNRRGSGNNQNVTRRTRSETPRRRTKNKRKKAHRRSY